MSTPLDSRQLKAFVTLARTGSLTETAKELFLTHSAISHSMKALENDTGCRLLTRVGKKLELTEAGEALLDHAKRIVGEMGLARAALKLMPAACRVTLRQPDLRNSGLAGRLP